jgi:hypothetical protein
MSKGSRSGRLSVVVLVAVLGVTMSLVVDSAPAAAGPGHARAAKKCKKKHRSASSAKKKCKKKAPVPVVTPPPPPPTPQALTAIEVQNRVIDRALVYCNEDPDCTDYGYYWDTAPGDPYCSEKSTYTWRCEGYNDWDDGMDSGYCDFYEVVERDGINGIKSHLDTSFGTDGFDCFTFV